MATYSKIFAILKSIGRDNEWLHTMLPEWTGKTSLKELSVAEIYIVVENLNKTKAAQPRARGMLTEKQEKEILRHKLRLDMKPQSLNDFIARTTGDKFCIEDLTITDASAVITGLRKLKTRSKQNVS